MLGGLAVAGKRCRKRVWMYSSLSLSLCVAGPVVSFPETDTVNLGSNLTLVCDVESNPPLMTVSITFNGDVLVNKYFH